MVIDQLELEYYRFKKKKKWLFHIHLWRWFITNLILFFIFIIFPHLIVRPLYDAHLPLDSNHYISRNNHDIKHLSTLRWYENKKCLNPSPDNKTWVQRLHSIKMTFIQSSWVALSSAVKQYAVSLFYGSPSIVFGELTGGCGGESTSFGGNAWPVVRSVGVPRHGLSGAA